LFFVRHVKNRYYTIIAKRLQKDKKTVSIKIHMHGVQIKSLLSPLDVASTGVETASITPNFI